jgi:Tol biopolymer transport system component
VAALAVLGLAGTVSGESGGKRTKPSNGLIAFADAPGRPPGPRATPHAQIFTITPDGRNKKQLTGGKPGNFFPAWSPDGTRLAFVSVRNGKREIWTVDSGGRNERLVTEGFLPAWSPDGKRLAFTRSDAMGRRQMWVAGADGKKEQQLTFKGFNHCPAWSPGGDKIAYWSGDARGFGQIWVMGSDGTHPTRLTRPEKNDYTPDGSSANAPAWAFSERIAYWAGREHRYGQVWTMKADGTDRKQLTHEPAPASSDNPAWSPDGRWILFDTQRRKRPEIWAMKQDGSDAHPLVSDLSVIPMRTSWQPVFSAAPSTDWPQFHGPRRDNVSAEKGLLESWPEGGPSRAWEATGLGEGYSTVAVVGKRIYTTGAIEGACVITALRRDGEKVWARKNGKAWAGSYPGTRSTPTVVDGRLYNLSGNGSLVCLEANDGDTVWTVDILKKFGGRNITWGLSESPLVAGDRVICTPGGEDVALAALDAKSGEVVWTCKGVGDKPGYASPIHVEHGGLKQIVTVLSESVVGVRASDGKLLWRYPHKVYADENITTPLFHGGFLVVSGCVRKGTTVLRLRVEGDGCSVEKQWHNRAFDNKQGGIVLLGGRLYGYAESQGRAGPWMCVDFASGETLYQASPLKSTYRYKNGCLTCADGRLYLFSDNGNMALVKPLEEDFEVAGRLRIEDPGERPTWAHPVVCGGRLYVRTGDKLSAYDVAGGAGRKGE